MVTPDELEFYDRLRIEIVRQAVIDLQWALRKSDRLGFECEEQIALEKWFLSSWGQLLSGDTGEYIIEKCRQNYKTNTTRKGSQRISDAVRKQIYADYKRGDGYDVIARRYAVSSQSVSNIVRRWRA